MKKLTTIALKIISGATGLLPTRWLIALVRSVLLVLRYRKQVINNNYILTNVSKSENISTEIFYRRNISYLSRLITESIKPLRKKNIKKITFDGTQEMIKSARSANGLILLASHYGNWELACSLLPLQTDLPIYGVYKPLKNAAADEYMLKRRSAHGLRLVPMKRIGRVIAKNVNEATPAIYILIADQNPNSKNSIIWADFLGVKSAFFNGPAKILDKYPLAASYMNIGVGPEPYSYQIDIIPMTVKKLDAGDIVVQYAEHLATQILQKPHHWLWSHKRWKRNHHPH